jgi:hypothetical protein
LKVRLSKQEYFVHQTDWNLLLREISSVQSTEFKTLTDEIKNFLKSNPTSEYHAQITKFELFTLLRSIFLACLC